MILGIGKVLHQLREMQVFEVTEDKHLENHVDHSESLGMLTSVWIFQRLGLKEKENWMKIIFKESIN